MLGKLQETKSLSNSMARATDLTKMTTWTGVSRVVERGAEDAYLIELKRVEQLVQLPVLANFFQLDVMLLQTMEGELRLVVDEDFQGLSRG